MSTDKLHLSPAEMRVIAHLIGNTLTAMPKEHPDYDLLVVVREKLRVKLEAKPTRFPYGSCHPVFQEED